MSKICLKCPFLGFTEYSTRLKFSRIEGLVDVPYWPKREVWSGLASSSRFRRGRWPQRCRWASARRLGWLWWNSQGSLAEGTMVTVRVCFSVKLLVTSFSDKRVRDKSKTAWMGPFILTDSSELLYYRVYLQLLGASSSCVMFSQLPFLVFANNLIWTLFCKSLWKKSASHFF